MFETGNDDRISFLSELSLKCATITMQYTSWDFTCTLLENDGICFKSATEVDPSKAFKSFLTQSHHCQPDTVHAANMPQAILIVDHVLLSLPVKSEDDIDINEFQRGGESRFYYLE